MGWVKEGKGEGAGTPLKLQVVHESVGPAETDETGDMLECVVGFESVPCQWTFEPSTFASGLPGAE